MRLCTIREAVMGSAEYKLPESVQQLMADFYLLQLLDHGMRRHESHRSDLIDREIEHVSSVLLPGIKKHMLSYVAYSMAREMRHFFDYCRLKSLPGRAPVYLTWVPEKYEFVTQFISKKLASTMLSTIPIEDRIEDDIQYYGIEVDEDTIWQIINDARRLSNGMGEISRADTDQEVEGIARAATQVFDPTVAEWGEEFGGPVWKDAASLWFKLAGAKSGRDIVHAVDRIYQQQHNSGALLNKSPEYEGHWLGMMLNLKYEANDPEQLMPMASSYMRKLASAVLANKHGRSYQGSQSDGESIENHMAAKVVQAIKADEEVSQAVSGLHIDEGTLIFSFKSYSGSKYDVRIYPRAQGRESDVAMNFYELAASPRYSGQRIHKRLMSPGDIVTALKLAY